MNNFIERITPMNKRVVGISVVGSINANLNADWEGYPRQVNDLFTATDGCRKYFTRNYADRLGLPLLVFKTYKYGNSKDKKSKILIPMTLEEKLISRGITSTDDREFMKQLFKCIDIELFGGTIAVKGHNLSITGAVQFNMGVNKYVDTQVFKNTISSPFVNSSNKEATQSTNGSKLFTDEAHYFYDFTVEPKTYDYLKELDNTFNGLTEEAYDFFKKALLEDVNSYNSVSKKGCYNEFAFFVELKENSKKYLGELSRYATFRKEDDKNIIDLSLLMDKLSEIYEDIDKIEMYSNQIDTEIIISEKWTKLDKENKLVSKSIINDEIDLSLI